MEKWTNLGVHTEYSCLHHTTPTMTEWASQCNSIAVLRRYLDAAGAQCKFSAAFVMQ